MQKISLRVFYGFPGVKTIANGRAASAPAEHLVIHRTIARKKKRHPKILLFYRKKISPFQLNDLKEKKMSPNLRNSQIYF